MLTCSNLHCYSDGLGCLVQRMATYGGPRSSLSPPPFNPHADGPWPVRSDIHILHFTLHCRYLPVRSNALSAVHDAAQPNVLAPHFLSPWLGNFCYFKKEKTKGKQKTNRGFGFLACERKKKKIKLLPSLCAFPCLVSVFLLFFALVLQ